MTTHSQTNDPQTPTAEEHVASAAVEQGGTATLAARALGLLAHPSAPFWAAAILIAAVAGFLGTKLLPRIGGNQNVVVFDPVRFINAQRAAASILSTQPNADLALTMTQVAKQAEAVILEEADGAVVLVKQAVVVPSNLRDITDDVLNRFNLPTNVPTVTTNPVLSLENVAPTDSSLSSGAIREDYRMELEKRSAEAARTEAKKSAHEQMVP